MKCTIHKTWCPNFCEGRCTSTDGCEFRAPADVPECDDQEEATDG